MSWASHIVSFRNPQTAWFWGSLLLGTFSCTALEQSARDLGAVLGHFLRLEGCCFASGPVELVHCSSFVGDSWSSHGLLWLQAGLLCCPPELSQHLPSALGRRSAATCPAERGLEMDPFTQVCHFSGSRIIKQISRQCFLYLLWSELYKGRELGLTRAESLSQRKLKHLKWKIC